MEPQGSLPCLVEATRCIQVMLNILLSTFQDEDVSLHEVLLPLVHINSYCWDGLRRGHSWPRL